jgi:hypothetical protein
LKKLIHLLLVSAGGGLLLGAGMRFAEKRSSRPRAGDADRISLFIDRLDALEKKIAPLVLNDAAPAPPLPAAPQIADRLEQVEARLSQDLARRHEERLAAFGDELNRKLAARIDALENEISGQRDAVAELRECSLRTEQKLQRLLEGIDRLVDVRTLPKTVGRSRE